MHGLQDDEKIAKFEEQLRTQLADELEATKHENAEASLVMCKGQVEELYVAAAAEMARVHDALTGDAVDSASLGVLDVSLRFDDLFVLRRGLSITFCG